MQICLQWPLVAHKNLQEVMSSVAMQGNRYHTDMAIALGSLQSTSATVPAGAVDIQSVPINNEVVANIVVRPVQALATGYEGLHLTYTIPQLDKVNYIDWAAKIENRLEIQGV